MCIVSWLFLSLPNTFHRLFIIFTSKISHKIDKFFDWIIPINSIKDFSEADDDFYSQRHSILTEFCQSLWFALISNTDLICYLLVFMNMVASQSLLAMPMPLMVFLWGTLTVPRPSKTFWVTLIAYTQVNRIDIAFS